MPLIGKYQSKRTGLVSEFRQVSVNSEISYWTKINDKIYKFDLAEFQKIWKKLKQHTRDVADKQELLL